MPRISFSCPLINDVIGHVQSCRDRLQGVINSTDDDAVCDEIREAIDSLESIHFNSHYRGSSKMEEIREINTQLRAQCDAYQEEIEELNRTIAQYEQSQ